MEKNAGLCAAEAFVLLSLPRYDVRQALKLGFMGLLAQGVLQIEQEDRPGLIRTRHIAHLRVAANLSEALPPITGSLVRITRAAAPDGLMRDVVKEAGHEYGRTLTGFIQNLVGPALIARGLAEMRQSRLLGLFPVTRFHRTPAGEEEKARLDGLLSEARAIPQKLESDPANVTATVAALGGAILLVEGLRPHYAAIDRALRPPSDSGGYVDAGGWDSGDHSTGLFDSGGLFDFGGIDFSAFDAGAFDSFDAGFSDAGGDGGGGDGGDGGSSGC
jgi:hypothetical protein